MKTIYLIRHGVARHNVPDATTGEQPDLFDPRYTDPSLIRQGELQASALGEQLKRRGASNFCFDFLSRDNGGRDQNSPRPIDLVITSPLTRCLETASLVFPSHFENGEVHGALKQAHVSTVSTAEAMVLDNASKSNSESDVFILDGSCKVCVHGDVREAYGMHYPDKRSPLSQLRSKFPTVIYHPHLTEQDAQWTSDTRETREDVVRRVNRFFDWLLLQPHHDNIAIVSHGVWIECALMNYCPEVLDFGKRRVYNCEVYCGKLESVDSKAVLRDMKQSSFYPA